MYITCKCGKCKKCKHREATRKYRAKLEYERVMSMQHEPPSFARGIRILELAYSYGYYNTEKHHHRHAMPNAE